MAKSFGVLSPADLVFEADGTPASGSVHVMTPFTAPFDEIQRDFLDAGIDVLAPGFYDDPAFSQRESVNPAYLNNYARFVRGRQYSAAYLERAEQVILAVGEILEGELVKEGREGACVDLNMVFSRILDKEGVWNHIVSGSLTVESPSGRLAGFPSLDFGDFVAGHAWLYAPPFDVVDLTIRQQPYDSPRTKGLLPPTIFEKVVAPFRIKPTDVCSKALLRMLAAEQGIPNDNAIFTLEPHLREFFPLFPNNLVKRELMAFRYVPVAVSASDAPLEKIVNFPMNGRFAAQIYDELVKPVLAAQQI
ncbi:MAG: hypothetical protein JWM47_4580 [Acidimicrobiales bacterium]|nr:hypothetical protein [Acidimicrobiales bacterium]